MLALVLLSLTTATSPAAPVSAKVCKKPDFEKIERKGPARLGKLGDMPPGKQILTVYNEVDGCPQPIVVRDGVGMPGK